MWFFSSATLNAIGVVWMMLLSEGLSCKYTKTSWKEWHWSGLGSVNLWILVQGLRMKRDNSHTETQSIITGKKRKKTKKHTKPLQTSITSGQMTLTTCNNLSSNSNQGRFYVYKIKPQATEQLDFRAQTEPRLSPSKFIQPFWCWCHCQTGFLQSETMGIHNFQCSQLIQERIWVSIHWTQVLKS